MPAARQRSRSPFRAWAVMAMIGRWLPVCPSRVRGWRRSPRGRPSRASARPSAPGRTAVVREGRQRLPAVVGRRPTVCPRFSSSAHGQLLVDQAVLGQQDRCNGRVRVPRGDPARLRGRPWSRAASSQGQHDGVEQLRLLDRLGAGRRRRPARGSAPCRRGGRPRSAS